MGKGRIALALAVLVGATAAPLAAAPILLHRGTAVIDSRALGADNDHQPEPGETFELVVTLGNEGDLARNITATLSSTNPALRVLASPPSVQFPSIAKDAMAADLAPHFRLEADPSLSCGQPVALDLALSYVDAGGAPFQATVSFLLFVGEVKELAREDFDTGPGGWQQDIAASSGTAGRWVNASPQAYMWAGELAQPGRDVTWPDVSCYYTGQNLNPANPSFENVDGGTQVLVSRIYDLSTASNVYLSYARWFYTDDGAGADSWKVEMSDDGGASWVLVETVKSRVNAWTHQATLLDPLLSLSNNMKVRVIAEDGGLASVCEAAIDDLVIASYTCGVNPAEARLSSSTPAVDDTIDPLCGDGDGVPDAGETIDYSVTVVNRGTTDAVNATATLRAPLPPELTLLGPATASLGTLADNGGAADAIWRLKVGDAVACQTNVLLTVDLAATPPFQATPKVYPLVLEEDVNQPTLRWYDDFDSGLTPWSVVLYGVNNDWALGQEDCAQNPTNPPSPTLNFWYTGLTPPPTNCQVSPYRANDDSAIRTPRIDSGFARPLLQWLGWNQLLTMTPGDNDAAEVWIDHDDDGVYTKIARYQGQVTTNGDTLDPALIDLQNNPLGVDLTATARHVTVEFRFISDATGGGGNPLSLGWMVDNVELIWTDADGRRCDGTLCGSCLATARIAPSKTQACVDERVTLDGQGSTLAGCPAPGVAVYDWFREGLPFASGPSSITVQEATPATYTYRLELSCSTDRSCKSSRDQQLVVLDCPSCNATAVLAPAPPSTCAGVAVLLDASGSTLANCPAPGVQSFRWLRNTVVVPGATGPTLSVNEAAPGTFTYTVEISCSTDATCKDTLNHVLLVTADGLPTVLGNTVRGQRMNRDVAISWTDAQPLAASWQVDRSTDKTMSGTILPAPGMSILDAGALNQPPSLYFYRIRAMSCSGQVGPW